MMHLMFVDLLGYLLAVIEYENDIWRPSKTTVENCHKNIINLPKYISNVKCREIFEIYNLI